MNLALKRLVVPIVFPFLLSLNSCNKAETPAPQPVQPAPSKIADPSAPVEKSIQPSDLTDEVLKLLREQHPHPESLKLDQVKEQALQVALKKLGPSVEWVENSSPEKKPATESISHAMALDAFVCHVRINRVDDQTAPLLTEAIEKLQRIKNPAGFILDLRFAGGTQYDQVTACASIFLSKKTDLFTMTHGKKSKVHSSNPQDITQAPLVILINRETWGSAELFAAVLQDQKRAILLGSTPTAGKMFETQDIKLTNGKTLRMATGRITLAHGGDRFLKEIRPDVLITMGAPLERQLHALPFQPPYFRMENKSYSEAILTGLETPPPLKKNHSDTANDPPSNRDSVLVGAMDLLKSIQALGMPSSSSVIPEKKG